MNEDFGIKMLEGKQQTVKKRTRHFGDNSRNANTEAREKKKKSD